MSLTKALKTAVTRSTSSKARGGAQFQTLLRNRPRGSRAPVWTMAAPATIKETMATKASLPKPWKKMVGSRVPWPTRMGSRAKNRGMITRIPRLVVATGMFCRL